MDKVKTDFTNGGYYTVQLTDRVSIISLNTIYYDDHKLGVKQPWASYMHDPNYPAVEQLVWLENIF